MVLVRFGNVAYSFQIVGGRCRRRSCILRIATARHLVASRFLRVHLAFDGPRHRCASATAEDHRVGRSRYSTMASVPSVCRRGHLAALAVFPVHAARWFLFESLVRYQTNAYFVFSRLSLLATESTGLTGPDLLVYRCCFTVYRATLMPCCTAKKTQIRWSNLHDDRWLFCIALSV